MTDRAVTKAHRTGWQSLCSLRSASVRSRPAAWVLWVPLVLGLLPGMPRGVTPPIATLPPPTGLTPTVPGAVTPPIGAFVPPDVATRVAAAADVNCGVGLPPLPANGPLETRAADCGESQLGVAAPVGAIIPLTEGRDLVVESLWNGWVDLHHIGSKDRRNGLDLDGSTGGVTLGVDRRFGANFVAGLSLSLDRSDSNGGYPLQGSVAGQSFSLAMSSASSTYGMAEASGEVTRSFTLSGGSVVAPYARLAARDEFARPNDGEISWRVTCRWSAPAHGADRCASARGHLPTGLP